MTRTMKQDGFSLRAEWFGAAAFGSIELPTTTFERIELPRPEDNVERVERAVIVDYGLGNLKSITNALARLGVAVDVTADPARLRDAQALILPGVGAFGRAMDNLRAAGLVDSLKEAVIVRRRPTLGICLGMQVLAESSDELGSHLGLGWIEGRVERLNGPLNLPVPHVGWNQVEAKASSVLFEGIPASASFYFDHSYALRRSSASISECDYDGRFVAAVEQDNLMAIQCHPEKSQVAGLRVLANFLAFAASRN